MTLTDLEKLALADNVISWRRKGGEKIKSKFGLDYFKNLNKLSQEKRKANKLLRRTII